MRTIPRPPSKPVTPSRWTSSCRPARTENWRSRVLRVRLDQLHGGVGARPGLVTIEVQPTLPFTRTLRPGTPSPQSVRSAVVTSGPPGELRTGAEVEAVRAPGGTPHGEVVRCPRPSRGAGDHLPDRNAVHRHAAVGRRAVRASRAATGIPAPRRHPSPSPRRASEPRARRRAASRPTARQRGPVLPGSGLQVADGALLLLVVVGSRSNGRRGRRTGSAPGPRRSRRCGTRSQARWASIGGACASMMPSVRWHAAQSRPAAWWSSWHAVQVVTGLWGSRVTGVIVALDAGDLRMRRVLEADRPSAWGLPRNARP